jgi:hypothetical protein
MTNLKSMRGRAVLGLVALAVTTGGAIADSNEGFSPSQMAEIRSVFFNDTPVTDAAVDQLTADRVDFIQASFDIYLGGSSDVDSLPAGVVARVQQQFEDDLPTAAPRSLFYAKTK